MATTREYVGCSVVCIQTNAESVFVGVNLLRGEKAEGRTAAAGYNCLGVVWCGSRYSPGSGDYGSRNYLSTIIMWNRPDVVYSMWKLFINIQRY